MKPLDILNRVSEYSYPLTLLGNELLPPTVDLQLPPRPIRVICEVVKCLRVGHQAEDPAGRVAYPGNVP